LTRLWIPHVEHRQKESHFKVNLFERIAHPNNIRI
jgi:hypothetical protein